MFRYIIFYCLMQASFSLLAVEVNDLYVAKVAVESQSSAERNRALQQAMSVVIVKVGGDKSVLKSPIIKSSLRKYKSYYSQFHYHNDNDQTFAVVTFNEDSINQLFIEANLPLWGSLRPQILVWLVEENGFSRTIVSASANSDTPSVIEQFSVNRGLPLILPLMDLTDIQKVSVSDLWGRFLTPVKQHSSRYMSDMNVVIRLSNSSLLEPRQCNGDCETSRYTLDWTLFTDNMMIDSKMLSLDYQGEEQGELLSAALDDLTQSIYQRYALTGDNDKTYVIDVANIDTMKDYVELSLFMKELSAIKEAKLIGANGRNRRFELELMGSKPAFLASLKLNDRLKQYIDPLAATNDAAVPVFIWNDK